MGEQATRNMASNTSHGDMPQELGLTAQSRQLSRQLSERELNRILNSCIKASEAEDKPCVPPSGCTHSTCSTSHRSLVPTVLTVTQMLEVLTKIRGTAELVSSLLRNHELTSRLSVWKSKTRQASWPSVMHSLAQEAFESADQTCIGSLDAEQANGAYRDLRERLQCELGDSLVLAETHQPIDWAENESISFCQFLKAMSIPGRLPAVLQPAAEAAVSGVRCVCGHWLVKKERASCYAGGRVRCDFTGENVTS